MKRTIYILTLLTVASISLTSFKPNKPVEGSAIKWMSFEEAIILSQKQPKKIFIDVYTEWCGWCKRMDKVTFTDPQVIKLMNENYYAVKFDAESKTPINFNNKTFEYKAEYKAHELALALLNGKMSYPTTVYLDESFNMLTAAPGYMEGPQMSQILNYFGSNIYKDKKWEDYQNEINQNKKGAE